MKLEILNVQPNSDPKKEFIAIVALADTNTNEYCLLVKIRSKPIFEIVPIPVLELKKDHAVFIFTGKGKNKYNKDKSKVFFFNQSDKAYWINATFESVCLFEISKAKKIKL
ncbi:hypothetical protein [Flavobacterium sp. UBA7682]|uniref:hypothetical protein n=1 Tax=Flavobacterium sp. UBA7682 TaxID=1946560 RepID=UPI0025C57139|nr:hypothetical protein [Flavobacterium sp. UBA7682]